MSEATGFGAGGAGAVHAVSRGSEGGHIVFVHGSGGSRLNWGRQMAALAATHRVTAIDLPGHGRSSPPGRQTVAAYAADVAGAMEALGAWPAVLVGHSLGGAIVLTLALERPELVRGLVLVGTGARLRVLPAVLEGLEANFDEAIGLVDSVAFGPRAGAGIRRASRLAMRRTGAQTLLGDFLACDRFDVMARLSSVSVPTLVLCGSEDRLTPPKYASFLAKGIPGAQLEVVPGAGHMVMLERPQKVSGAINRFVAGLPPAVEACKGRS